MVADDQGRFLFRDLAKGAYLFSAEAPGYLNGGYGQWQLGGTAQPFALAEDERAGDVTVRLWKAAPPSVARSATTRVDQSSACGSRSPVESLPADACSSACRNPGGRTSPALRHRGAYQVSDLMPGRVRRLGGDPTTAMPIALLDADTAASGSLRASGSNAMSMGMSAMSPGVRLGDFVLQTSDRE